MRVMPFRTASEASVDWVAPIFYCDGEAHAEGPLPSWSYQSSVTVVGSFTIDEAELLKSTALTTLEHIDAIMQVECQATGYRVIARAPARSAVSVPSQLTVDVAPGVTADELSARYLLVHRGPTQAQPSSMAASVKGARLLADSAIYRAQLEGHAPGFPTEAFSFVEAGRYPSGALWYLRFAPQLDLAFTANARLFINTSHKASSDLLGGKSEVTKSVVLTGVLQQMLDTVASSLAPSDVSIDGLDEDSTGVVLDQLTTNFLHLGLAQAISEFSKDRAGVCARLQEATTFLGGGVK